MDRRQFLKLSSVLPAAALSDFDIIVGELDSTKKYLVVVSIDDGYELPPSDALRAKERLEYEIEYAFKQIGIDDRDIGIIFLNGISMEIIEVDG